ncbi:DUF6332 family protein [Streptomyces sp. NPDC002932]|uniref:DUF6332 family protein n=1 Tax=Streptomyces sp. NPDC002932 TaxID=3364672 RepID=UPI00369E2B85
MGYRSQADRDAMTVEIGFAVLTGAVLAAVAFVMVYAPTAFLAPHNGLRSVLLMVAAGVAALVFMGRVIDVLWRFGRRDSAVELRSAGPASGAAGGTARGPAHGPAAPVQPSQPGRTSPDS